MQVIASYTHARLRSRPRFATYQAPACTKLMSRQLLSLWRLGNNALGTSHASMQACSTSLCPVAKKTIREQLQHHSANR